MPREARSHWQARLSPGRSAGKLDNAARWKRAELGFGKDADRERDPDFFGRKGYVLTVTTSDRPWNRQTDGKASRSRTNRLTGPAPAQYAVTVAASSVGRKVRR